MKSKLFFLSALILGICCSWLSPGEYPALSDSKTTVSFKENALPMFSYFRTHRQGRTGVTCTWGVGVGTGATAFILQKTYEYPDEYTVWENICNASANSRGTFSYTDNNCYPGVISYRVMAVNGTTPLFVSEISEVQIRQH